MRVCIDVPDVDRAVEFYGRALGLAVGRRFAKFWVEMTGAAVPVDLLLKEAGSSPSTATAQTRDFGRHWTPVHLDVVVDDLDAAVTRARAAGAVLERDIQSHAWGRLALLADPFGHGFCLLEFKGRGYDEIVGLAGTSESSSSD
jgi:predicted enzyme related to lactoylglutathione lyase